MGAWPVANSTRFLLWGPDGTFQAPTFPDGSVLPTVGVPGTELAATVSLGAMLPKWRSKFFDVQAPDLEKLAYTLQITHLPEAAGIAKIDVYADLAAAVRDILDLDLTEPYDKKNVQACLQSVHAFAFRVRLETPTVDVGFELMDLLIQYQITEPE